LESDVLKFGTIWKHKKKCGRW